MKFLKFQSIDSTNTYALENFDKLEHKDVISAEEQTQGRGRFNRKWISKNQKNIYATFVLKPSKKDFLVNLTQYLCLVCVKTMKSYGVQTSIKWPNDVLYEGKKLSGILCETDSKNNEIKGVALGIGINLNSTQKTFENIEKPATSLSLILGKEIDKDDFLNRLCEEFFKNYDNFEENGFSAIKKEYLENINFLGQKIKIQNHENEAPKEFIAKSIDERGFLIVYDEDGEEKTIFSGDII